MILFLDVKAENSVHIFFAAVMKIALMRLSVRLESLT